jgi:hypothetical protein
MFFFVLLLLASSLADSNCPIWRKELCEAQGCWWYNGNCVEDTLSPKCKAYEEAHGDCPDGWGCGSYDNVCQKGTSSYVFYNNKEKCIDRGYEWLTFEENGANYSACYSYFDECSMYPKEVCESFLCSYDNQNQKCFRDEDITQFCEVSPILSGSCDTSKCVEVNVTVVVIVRLLKL